VIAAVVHSLLAAGACCGLWLLWRRWFSAAEPRVQLIVSLGLLARALAGQLLFWISFLDLPIARSLHFGGGYWFFGLDGAAYMAYANSIVGRGLGSLLVIEGPYPSRAFVQILTAFVAAFGGVEPVGLLLNLLAFLVTCTLLVRLQPRTNGALLFALAALAFGPAVVLWSLQPLKDTAFVCVLTLLLFLLFRWQERPRLWLAAAMLALFYALATLRWYMALIAWALLPLFFLLAALRMPRRRAAALLAGLLVFAVVSQAVRRGGGTDIHPLMARFLDPHTAIEAARRPQMTRALDSARRGFEHTRGNTTLQPGHVLATTTTQPAPPPTPLPRRREPPPPATATQRIVRLLSGSAAALVPRTIGQPLGLFEVGGGRGLWLFADADTLALDAVLGFAFVYCVRARRRITPLFVLVLLFLLVTGGPLFYTVNNFGTLLRLRGMIYVLAAVLPLTLAPESPASAPGCR
jgi:hypothetical protein